MRYAIYYAPPPNTGLWQAASRWIGRDAQNGQILQQPRCQGIEADRQWELTRPPRRYGLHATLKPPFRLASGKSEERLKAMLRDFAARQVPFPLPRLALGMMDDFFCLKPTLSSPSIMALASACVKEFDTFRAPLTPSELARRKAAILSEQEKENLAAWGYPYLFNQFRFHVTLTTRITNPIEKEAIHSVLTEIITPVLTEPLMVDSICLFLEPAPGQDMLCIDRFPFTQHASTTKDSTTHANLPPEKNLHPRHQRHPA